MKKIFFYFFLIASLQGQYVQARSLKILMLVNSFPTLSITFIVNQITSLLDHGHDVFICAQKIGDNLKVQPDVLKYDLLSRTFYKDLPHDINSYDIIIAQFGQQGVWLAQQKKTMNFKPKIITFFRGCDISARVKNFPHLYNDLFKIGDLFIPVSNFFKQRILKKGCNKSKIRVLHSGIDCSKFPFKKRKQPSNGIINIVTVGRLIEKKGIEYAIRAVAQVYKKHKNIRYKIVGGGELLSSLQQLVKSLNAEPYVEFCGTLISDEVRTILAEAHVFMLPSVTAKNGDEEGIPNALKEAMSTGLPVISTRHSGIPELIEDGKNGFLVPEKDSGALADKLAFLIEHQEMWVALGKNARTTIEQEYNQATITTSFEQVLYELVSQ